LKKELVLDGTRVVKQRKTWKENRYMEFRLYCDRNGNRKTSLVTNSPILLFILNRPEVKSFPEFVVAMMTYKCPPIPEHLSDIAKDFIAQCCQYDKKLRPKTEALLQHPFLADDE